MSQFSNPVLFSDYFNIDPALLDDSGLIDPFINVDTPLFIDPVLLQHSVHPIIREEAYHQLKTHFERITRTLAISKRVGDVAWVAAQRLLNLNEAPFNGLGYGTSDRRGSSRPDSIRDTILHTIKEIIELGTVDPEMISFMGLFEENVGADTISDLTSRVIQSQLAGITAKFCRDNNIPVRTFQSFPDIPLPYFKTKRGKLRAILLIPIDIVRELPIANDWSEVSNAVHQNIEIRNRVNAKFAGWMEMTVRQRKEGLREALFESSELINLFISTLKENKTFYDPKQDNLGYYLLRRILAENNEHLIIKDQFDFSKGIEEITRMINATLDMFAHHVENGNLWEELWIGEKPKKERAAQLLYFAIADSFCKANNIDISPEANMGGGPIDFKFSRGYKARVLVELKKSTGTIVHGYEKQLEIYKDSSRTNHGIFVIIDYGNLENKLATIEAIRNRKLMNREHASDIKVINASKKESASKRK